MVRLVTSVLVWLMVFQMQYTTALPARGMCAAAGAGSAAIVSVMTAILMPISELVSRDIIQRAKSMTPVFCLVVLLVGLLTGLFIAQEWKNYSDDDDGSPQRPRRRKSQSDPRDDVRPLPSAPLMMERPIYGLDAAPMEFATLVRQAKLCCAPGESQLLLDRLLCNKCGNSMRLGSEKTGELYWRCSAHRAGKNHCDGKMEVAVKSVMLVTNAENAIAG